MNKIIVFTASKIFSLLIHLYSVLTHINYKDIPIVINNRNRLDFLQQLIFALTKRGYNNIIIIDNNSSYQPLHDYYKTLPFEIILLDENLGYKSLEQLPLYRKIRKNFFVYTDSDVLPIEACPENFMDHFLKVLRENIMVTKVGFSLKVDDLPDFYEKKSEVIQWESQFYEKESKDGYAAPIDTTFALHKPYALISTRGVFNMVRTRFPYQAYHMPWYNDSKNLSEEEQYYINHVEIGTHWSKGLDVSGRNFIQRILGK